MKVAIKLIGLLLPALAAQAASSDWVSLYSGSESSLNVREKSRIESALKALGIDHKIEQQLIFVKAENRTAVQDLVIDFLFKSQRRSEAWQKTP